MSSEKVSERDFIHFIVQVRQWSAAEGNERRNMGLIRNLANKMYRDYIGYNYRGEHRLKARGEAIFAESRQRRREYEDRFGELEHDGRTITVTWLGHAGFWLEGSASVVIDPYLRGQRHSPLIPAQLRPVDLVLATMDHPHHLGDALEIAHSTGATLVTPPGVIDPEEGRGVSREELNLGGSLQTASAKITMLESRHLTAGGSPAVGYLVEMGGYRIYHTGDTAFFSDLEQVARDHAIDLLLIPIGDRYTMGPRDAARAVELIRPRYVIPMHFGTSPEIQQDPENFAHMVGEIAEVIPMKPGKKWTLDRRPPESLATSPEIPQGHRNGRS